MKTRPIREGDTAALARLFEATGSPCYCRYFHFEGDKNDWLMRCADAPGDNRREMEEAVSGRREDGLGVVAVDGDDVVGWAKLAPAAAIRKAYEQRYYRGLPCLGGDREGVYLLSCSLVRADWRRRGVATALVAAAIDLARSRGARRIEAFPRRPRERVSDEELWTIPTAALEHHGFTVCGGEDPYPVLALDLR